MAFRNHISLAFCAAFFTAGAAQAQVTSGPEVVTGLGLRFDKSANHLRVTGVIPGSPAHENHIRAGDYISRVNGASVKDMTLDQSTAALTRAGENSLTLSVRHSRTLQDRDINLTKASIPANVAYALKDEFFRFALNPVTLLRNRADYLIGHPMAVTSQALDLHRSYDMPSPLVRLAQGSCVRGIKQNMATNGMINVYAIDPVGGKTHRGYVHFADVRDAIGLIAKNDCTATLSR